MGDSARRTDKSVGELQPFRLTELTKDTMRKALEALNCLSLQPLA